MLKNKLVYVLIIILFVLSIGMVFASDNSTSQVSIVNDNSADKMDVYEVLVDSYECNSSILNENQVIAEGNLSEFKYNGCPSVVEVTPQKHTLIKTQTNYKSNIITNTPMKSVKVLPKAGSKKTKESYRSTSEKGMAELNKDLQAGSYSVYAKLKDYRNKKFISLKNSKNKSKANPSKGDDCCSFYVQVSNNESVCGFRRDNDQAATIRVKTVKWYGRTVVKHYKRSSGYFCHLIATSDGWMVGNGGHDDVNVVYHIERLAAGMMRSNKIKMSCLEMIQEYKYLADFGHFSIKAPDGRYAVVYSDSIQIGKLKPGEFLSNPNSKIYQRNGSYAKFGANPAKVAIKIGATDRYGEHRRQITVFHWKATTKDYLTTARINVHIANDDGKLIGKSFARYLDNIEFQNKPVNKRKIPLSPDSLFLGTLDLGNIDYLIKTRTKVDAPVVISNYGDVKYFKILVKTLKTNESVKNTNIKVNITCKGASKAYTFKTDDNGVVKFSTEKLGVGTYKIGITTANNRYVIYKNSTIVIQKTQTVVDAPKVTSNFGEDKYFKILVKNKNTNKTIKNTKIKVRINYKDTYRDYTFKTNNKGIVQFSTAKFKVGTYTVGITSGDSNYIISKNTKIVIQKTQTVVDAPKVTSNLGEDKYFKIVVKSKNTNEPIKNTKIKVNITYNGTFKEYVFKTNNKAIVQFSTAKLRVGTYMVRITSVDENYIISKNSKIVING